MAGGTGSPPQATHRLMTTGPSAAARTSRRVTAEGVTDPRKEVVRPADESTHKRLVGGHDAKSSSDRIPLGEGPMI